MHRLIEESNAKNAFFGKIPFFMYIDDKNRVKNEVLYCKMGPQPEDPFL